MSSITWHTQDEGKAVICGWERAWLGRLVDGAAATFLPTFGDDLAPRVNPRHYLAQSTREGWLSRDVATALRVESGCDGETTTLVDLDGTPLDGFSLLLNTALATGNDAVCLAARIHAQCEIHCYVDWPNRSWMAGLIERGRETGLYRSGAGWEDLVTLLRNRERGPVVASYSVTDSFPYCPESWPVPVDEDGEPDYDTWYELPDDERWALAWADISSNPDKQRELHPGNLRAPFGHSRSLIDLLVTSPAERVRALP